MFSPWEKSLQCRQQASHQTAALGEAVNFDVFVEGVRIGAADAKPEPRLVVGKTAGVLAEDTLAEAGRKVMRFHLARMLEREPGVRDGNDIEDIHKMRVATRRQRAAWRVFGEAFRKGRTKSYRAGLRDAARRLGAVRDLDVLLEGIDTYRADLPVNEQRALEPLISSLGQHRDDARALLIRELDSPGYSRFVDDYIDFVRTEGAAARPISGAAAPHRVRETEPSRIWAAYASYTSSNVTVRNEASSTFGEIESVAFSGPTEPATNRFGYSSAACRASRAPARFMSSTASWSA